MGRISGSAGLSGRIFHFAGYPAELSGRIFHFAGYPGRISGISDRIWQSPDIRHPARNTRSGQTLLIIIMYVLGLGRISGSAGLSGRIFHFAGYPARLSGRILNFAGISGRISGRIWQAPDIRHPARNTRSGQTLLLNKLKKKLYL